MLFAFCSVVVAIFMVSVIVQHQTKRQSFLLSKIPSPKKYPLVHNAWIFHKINITDILNEFESWRQKLGSVFHFSLYPFHSGFFIVTDPVAVKHLLFKINNPIKPSTYKVLKALLGEGLFSSSGEKWQKRHKLITASMTSSMMKKSVSRMNKLNDKFIEILRSKNGQSTELQPLVTHITLDVIYGLIKQ